MSARSKPAAGNVVSLRGASETTEEIVRDVQGRTARHHRQTMDQINDLVARLQAQHREKAQGLLPIGYAMSGVALADWLEIGRRMLASGGGQS